MNNIINKEIRSIITNNDIEILLNVINNNHVTNHNDFIRFIYHSLIYWFNLTDDKKFKKILYNLLLKTLLILNIENIQHDYLVIINNHINKKERHIYWDNHSNIIINSIQKIIIDFCKLKEYNFSGIHINEFSEISFIKPVTFDYCYISNLIKNNYCKLEYIMTIDSFNKWYNNISLINKNENIKIEFINILSNVYKGNLKDLFFNKEDNNIENLLKYNANKLFYWYLKDLIDYNYYIKSFYLTLFNNDVYLNIIKIKI